MARPLPGRDPSARTARPVLTQPGQLSDAQLEAAFQRGAGHIAQKRAAEQGGPSLWGQFSDIVTGLPSGIVHMGVDAAKDVQGIGRTLKDAATGDLGNDATDYFPLLTGVGASFKRTGNRIIHPSEYLKAAKDGTIVSSLLEDVGNAALVGSLASKPITLVAGEAAARTAAARTVAGDVAAQAASKGIPQALAEEVGANAARVVNPNPTISKIAAKVGEAVPESARPLLTRAGEVGARLTHGLNEAANAPARVWTAPIGFAAKHVLPVLKESGPAQRLLASDLGQTVSQAATDFGEKRAQRATVRQDFLLPQSAEAHVAADWIDKAITPAKKVLGNDTDLQHATMLLRAGTAPTLDALTVARQHLDDTQFDQVLNETFGREQKPSPATIQTVQDYRAGTLDPKVAGKIDEAQSVLDRVIGRVEESKLTGEGRKGGALNPEQLGDRPMQSKIDKHMAGWLDDNPTADAAARATEQARLLAGPKEVATGAYKPALFTAERAKRSVDEMATSIQEATGDAAAAESLRRALADVPTMMQELTARGEMPGYLPGAVDDPRAGTATVAGSQRPGLFRTKSERQKGYGTIPKHLRTVQRELAREMQSVARNKSAVMLRDEFGVTASQAVGDLVKQGKIAPYEADHLLGPTSRGTPDLDTELARHKLTPWDPQAPGGRVPAHQVGPDTILLPTPITTEFDKWWKPATSQHAGMRGYDYLTRGFKHNVLAMSPRWHIYNVLGNSFMATVGGGESPMTIFRMARTVRKVMKQEVDLGEQYFPPRLYGAGGAAEQARMMADAAEPRTPLGRVINKSYAMNETVDNIGRSALYMAKKARGFTDEQAVKISLRALGDFSNLTPFERNTVRRVLPFYSWMRHVTQLTSHLALEHPWRVAWTLHMGDMFTDPEEQKNLPGWLKGALHLGGNTYLPLQGANPFAGSAGSPFTSPKDWPMEILRGLNPVMKFGAQSIGLNLGAGRLVTRPPGTGPMNESGKPLLSLQSPGELAYMAAQMVPAGKMLTQNVYNPSTGELLPEPVLRYDNGEPVKSQGRFLPADGGRLRPLLTNLGIPAPITVDVAQQRARQLKAKARADKSRAAYYRTQP